MRIPRKPALLAVASLVAGLTLAACTTTRIYRAKDHKSMPVTQLELIETTSFGISGSVEHVFLLCQDTADTLLCHRVCGVGTDLQCPTAVTSEGITTSNVR